MQYSQYLYLLAKYASPAAGGGGSGGGSGGGGGGGGAHDGKWEVHEQQLPASGVVDAVWHAHLLHAAAYRRDSERVVGFALLHRPWPAASSAERDAALFARLHALWHKEFDAKHHPQFEF